MRKNLQFPNGNLVTNKFLALVLCIICIWMFFPKDVSATDALHTFESSDVKYTTSIFENVSFLMFHTPHGIDIML